MAAQPLSMRKISEDLRLAVARYSGRAIARSLGVPRAALRTYLGARVEQPTPPCPLEDVKVTAWRLVTGDAV